MKNEAKLINFIKLWFLFFGLFGIVAFVWLGWSIPPHVMVCFLILSEIATIWLTLIIDKSKRKKLLVVFFSFRVIIGLLISFLFFFALGLDTPTSRVYLLELLTLFPLTGVGFSVYLVIWLIKQLKSSN